MKLINLFQKMKKRTIIFLCSIFIFCLIWIPYIFPYFCNVDEPGHFVDAFGLLKGKLLYKEIFEPRGPFIPFIHLFFIKISSNNYTFFLNLTLFLCLIIESYLIYKILSEMDIKNEAIYGFFFPVFVSLFYPKDMIIGGEPFISVILVLICYLSLKLKEDSNLIFLIGFLSGLIILWKLFGIFLILLLPFCLKLKNFKRIFFVFLISLLPFGIFLSYIFKNHIWQDFLLWNIKYPIFLSKGIPVFKKFYFIFPMLGRIFLLIPFFTVFGIPQIIKKNKSEEEKKLMVFLIFSILWGISHSLPFPHYYRLMFPFLFIFSFMGYYLTILVIEKNYLLKKIINIFILFSILQTFFYWHGIDFYKKWKKFIADKEWRKEFERKNYENLLSFLRENTSKQDKIIIWGHNPKLYLLSELEPGTMFAGFLDPVLGIVFYDVSKIRQFPPAEEIFIQELKNPQVKYFIDAIKHSLIGIPYYTLDKYPEINECVVKNYEKMKEIDGFIIYKRKE